MFSNLYLGATNEEWQLLSYLAEDLFYNEIEGGQQVLGIYPFGNRLYGFESEPPDLLFIYLNDISKILNPLEVKWRHTVFKGEEYKIGKTGGSVIFMDLYGWIANLEEYIRRDPLAYIVPSKLEPIRQDEDMSNIILVVANLDYRHKQSGWVELFLEELGLDPTQPYKVHDLLAEATYQWQGPRNYVEFDPKKIPAHIFRIQRDIDRIK